jgi:hypothetical protein
LWMDAVKIMNDTGQKALFVMNERHHPVGIIYHDRYGKTS